MYAQSIGRLAICNLFLTRRISQRTDCVISSSAIAGRIWDTSLAVARRCFLFPREPIGGKRHVALRPPPRALGKLALDILAPDQFDVAVHSPIDKPATIALGSDAIQKSNRALRQRDVDSLHNPA